MRGQSLSGLSVWLSLAGWLAAICSVSCLSRSLFVSCPVARSLLFCRYPTCVVWMLVVWLVVVVVLSLATPARPPSFSSFSKPTTVRMAVALPSPPPFRNPFPVDHGGVAKKHHHPSCRVSSRSLTPRNPARSPHAKAVQAVQHRCCKSRISLTRGRGPFYRACRRYHPRLPRAINPSTLEHPCPEPLPCPH